MTEAEVLVLMAFMVAATMWHAWKTGRDIFK